MGALRMDSAAAETIVQAAHAASARWMHPAQTRGKGRYRVTGYSAIPRFQTLCGAAGLDWEEANEASAGEKLDLAWQNEARTEAAWLTKCRGATCFNKLSGTWILEDKASLAMLMTECQGINVLQANIVKGDSIGQWCADTNPFENGRKWWMVKDSAANGSEEAMENEHGKLH